MLSQVIVTVLTVTCLTPRHASAAEIRGAKPDIVIILADDLGETNNLIQTQSDRGNELPTAEGKPVFNGIDANCGGLRTQRQFQLAPDHS